MIYLWEGDKTVGIQQLLAAAALWLLLPATLAGIDLTVGRMIAAEGDPRIVRGARPLQVSRPHEQDVLNMDHFALAADDRLQLQLFPAEDADTRLLLDGNTTAYTLRDPSRGELQIRLLDGSVELQAAHIPRGQQVVIQVGNARVVVRGTELQVDSRRPGEYLVTVAEGRAEVVHGSRGSIIALPEQPVEYTRKNGFRAVSTGEDEGLAEFRADWREQRNPDADAARESFQADYQRADAAYGELMQHQEITDTWIVEDRQRSRSGNERALQQTAAISADLQAAAAALRELEQYPLQEYIPAAADEAERRMHMVRYLMALYAERNQGRLPLP